MIFANQSLIQAVVQLDTNHGVDYEPNKDIPPKECFNLTIEEFPDIRSRNKSEIIVKSCFAWLCTDESPVSGMAMLEVDIPSGYIMLQVLELETSIREVLSFTISEKILRFKILLRHYAKQAIINPQ